MLLILGDPHLGAGQNIGKSGIGGSFNSRVVDQINLLDWTLNFAVEKEINHIVITGDVFEDPKPHTSLITIFMSWAKKCSSNGVKLHIIQGNHDILRSGFIYSSPLDIISEAEIDGVYVYKDISTFSIDSMSFTIIPFRDRKSLGTQSNKEAIGILKQNLIYELSSIPISHKKTIIGHLAIEGSIPVGNEIDDLMNELFCPLDMFNGYDYVWMGHVHKPQVLQKQSPYIAHIGSMDVSNFGETDHKKHIVVIDTKHNSFHIESLPTRNLKKITLDIDDSIENVDDYIEEKLSEIKDLKNSIIKIDISISDTSSKVINKSAIEKILTSHGAFNVSGISEIRKKTKIKLDKKSDIINSKLETSAAIKSYADLYVEPEYRSKYIETAISIYNEFKENSKE